MPRQKTGIVADAHDLRRRYSPSIFFTHHDGGSGLLRPPGPPEPRAKSPTTRNESTSCFAADQTSYPQSQHAMPASTESQDECVRTSRILLRRMRLDDVADMHLLRERPEVMKYTYVPA